MVEACPHPISTCWSRSTCCSRKAGVARAAQRLRLSPSAMSRALARLRATIGDPLLVRAGRGLVPTPRAIELRERVRQLVQDCEAVLRPAEKLDLARLVRTFDAAHQRRVRREFRAGAHRPRRGEGAPGVRLRFVQKLNKDSTALRDATVDLETGVVGTVTGPGGAGAGLVPRPLHRVCAQRARASRGEITPARYASGRHICVSRRGDDKGPIDEALDVARSGTGDRHHRRRLRDRAGARPGFRSDRQRARTAPGKLRAGMHSFPLPVAMPEITVALLWHPRLDGDPAHRWLRGCVRDVCADAPLRSRRVDLGQQDRA